MWNEQAVTASIKHLLMTRIIVAHRPETIAMAQRVVVLERGQIVRNLMQPAAPASATHQPEPSAPVAQQS